MKASRRLAENDIITRGITVKIQQVAVRGNYENPSNDAKVKMSRADRNPWLAKMTSSRPIERGPSIHNQGTLRNKTYL